MKTLLVPWAIAENLWHHLRRLGLSENDECHPALGNIKQALEALVQQRLHTYNFQIGWTSLNSGFVLKNSSSK